MINVRVEATRLGRYAFGLLAFVCIRGDACGVEPLVTCANDDSVVQIDLAQGTCTPVPTDCIDGASSSSFLKSDSYSEVSVSEDFGGQVTISRAGTYIEVCAATDATQGSRFEFELDLVRINGSPTARRLDVGVVPEWGIVLESMNRIRRGEVVLPAASVDLCARIVDGEKIANRPQNSFSARWFPPGKCGDETVSASVPIRSTPPNAACDGLGSVEVLPSQFGCYWVEASAQPLDSRGNPVGDLRVDIFDFHVTDGPVAVISFDSAELRYSGRDVTISGADSRTGDPRLGIDAWSWTVSFRPPNASTWQLWQRGDRANLMLETVESGQYKLELVVTDTIGRTAQKVVEVDTRG